MKMRGVNENGFACWSTPQGVNENSKTVFIHPPGRTQMGGE